MSVRIKGVAAVAASVVFLVGCGNGPAASTAPPASILPSSAPSAASSAPPSASPSAATATVLLKVTSEGGFINPSANLNALPIVEVLGDGRILTPGAVDAIAPAPLLPTLEVRDTGAAGAAAILAAIRQAGLDQPATGRPGIPGDSGTDVFSVTIDGQTTETRLAGGGGGPGVGGPGVHVPSDSSDPGRAAAFDLLTRLQDPTVAWGGGAVQPTPYTPAGYLVYVIPGAPQNDPATAQVPVAWPLATPLATFGAPAANDRGITGLRQGVVLGADAATLGPILAKATVVTAFTSGGASFTLSVRPLLPDELGG
jgi:hypothetical protein